MKETFKMRHNKFFAIIACVNVFLVCLCDSNQKQEKAEQIKLTQDKTITVDTTKSKVTTSQPLFLRLLQQHPILYQLLQRLFVGASIFPGVSSIKSSSLPDSAESGLWAKSEEEKKA